jgi:hypothetical protein
MAESVRDLPDNIQNKIAAQEWEMRTLEGVARFKDLKAKSLPSIGYGRRSGIREHHPHAGKANRRNREKI